MATQVTIPEITLPDVELGVQDLLKQGIPKSALDALYGYRKVLKAATPSKTETANFIGMLKNAISQENKTSAPARCKALDSIIAYNANPGASHFTGVVPSTFAFQLALRIREPNLISQGKLGLCGANASVIHFAKTNPEGYAKLGIDLMKSGKGTFGQKEVEPNSTIRSGVTKLDLDAADFVVLASVRGGPGFLGTIFREGKEGIGQGMDAKDVGNLLKKAGYTDVEDHVHIFTSADWKENLIKAENRLSAGLLVLFSINSKLVTLMLEDKAKVVALVPENDNQGILQKCNTIRKAGAGAMDLPASPKKKSNHWVLVTKLKVTDDEITIKLYSWGKSVKRTMNRKNFMTYYEGFVCAKLGGGSIPEVQLA
jgi:hypothetical protein